MTASIEMTAPSPKPQKINIQLPEDIQLPGNDDIKDPLEDYIKGYPKLSVRMGLKPETAIFRKFSTLNARNLLYMQAELTDLEYQLDQITKEDNASTKGRKVHYATHYRCLSMSHQDGDVHQLQLIMTIRLKLKQYNKALLQSAKMEKLISPDEYDLHDLQHFLACSDMGPFCLEGRDAYQWGTIHTPHRHRPDLITLHPREPSTFFARKLAERTLWWLKCFGRFKSKDRVTGQPTIFDSSIHRLTFWITSAVAALLPIASIGVLVGLKSLEARLGTVAAFNVGISVALNLFTEAKGTDVFAVTAAFAAVQVVFIGADGGSFDSAR